MQDVLAHAGHSHGPDPALIALVIVVLVLAAVAGMAVVERLRAKRDPDRTSTR